MAEVGQAALVGLTVGMVAWVLARATITRWLRDWLFMRRGVGWLHQPVSCVICAAWWLSLVAVPSYGLPPICVGRGGAAAGYLLTTLTVASVAMLTGTAFDRTVT